MTFFFPSPRKFACVDLKSSETQCLGKWLAVRCVAPWRWGLPLMYIWFRGTWHCTWYTQMHKADCMNQSELGSFYTLSGLPGFNARQKWYVYIIHIYDIYMIGFIDTARHCEYNLSHISILNTIGWEQQMHVHWCSVERIKRRKLRLQKLCPSQAQTPS